MVNPPLQKNDLDKNNRNLQHQCTEFQIFSMTVSDCMFVKACLDIDQSAIQNFSSYKLPRNFHRLKTVCLNKSFTQFLHNFSQKNIFNNHVTYEKSFEEFIYYRNLKSYTIGIDRIVFRSYKSIDLNYLYFD